MRIRVCYLGCHAAGLFCYLVMCIHYSCFTSICVLFTDFPSYIPSLIKIVCGIQKLMGGYTDTTGAQHGVRISLLLFFQYRKSWLKTKNGNLSTINAGRCRNVIALICFVSGLKILRNAYGRNEWMQRERNIDISAKFRKTN
jgi:hypothetical protein